MRTDQENRDNDLCSSFRFLLKDYLYPTEQIVSTYIGFASNSFCYSPTVSKSYFSPDKMKESWKCDKSDTGYYAAVCRGWYKL